MGEGGISPKSKHIAVLTFPFTSHVAPLIFLCQKILEAAPDLKFSFFSTPQANASHFSTHDEFDKIKPYDVDTGLPEGYVSKGLGLQEEEVDYFLKATPRNFQSAIEKAVAETGLKISCLISDAFLWCPAEMAKDMQVPWIPFWTGGPRDLFLHFEIENIRKHMGINGPGEQTLEFLPGFSTIRAMDLPDGIVSGGIDSTLPVMLVRATKVLPQATAVAINSFERLEPILDNALESRLPKYLYIGPLLSPPSDISDKYGCLEWLDRRETSSVAYISFGTSVIPSPFELTALAEALEATEIPFIWSFRGNSEELFSKDFLERTSAYGKMVPWAPQSKILEHSSVGVFVTHGGMKSIMESIFCGVPMICRPYFAEQGLNSRTVETVWGIGLGLEGDKFTKEGLIEALKTILSSEEGKIMKEKVSVLKEVAVKAVGSEGCSTANFKALVEIVTKT